MPVVVIGSPFEGKIARRADTRTVGAAKARPFLGRGLNAREKQEQEGKTGDQTPACPGERFVMGLAAENLAEILRQGGLARADDCCASCEHERKLRGGKRTRSSLGIAFVNFAQ